MHAAKNAETLIIVFYLTDYYHFIYLQLPLQASDCSPTVFMNAILQI